MLKNGRKKCGSFLQFFWGVMNYLWDSPSLACLRYEAKTQPGIVSQESCLASLNAICSRGALGHAVTASCTSTWLHVIGHRTLGLCLRPRREK